MYTEEVECRNFYYDLIRGGGGGGGKKPKKKKGGGAPLKFFKETRVLKKY